MDNQRWRWRCDANGKWKLLDLSFDVDWRQDVVWVFPPTTPIPSGYGGNGWKVQVQYTPNVGRKYVAHFPKETPLEEVKAAALAIYMLEGVT